MNFRIIFSTIFILLAFQAYSQDSIVNVDDSFKEARELGFNGERRAAIDLSQRILLKSSTYSDIRIFLGRLYTWESQYDSARLQFLQVLKLDNKNEDAYIALIDCELYDEKPGNAFAYSIEALGNLENPSEEIYYRKAKALYDSLQYEESLDETNSILEKFPDFEKAKNLRESNLFALRTNEINTNFDYDDFNRRFGPWYLANINYSRQTKTFGAVVGRLNYADRFDTTGYQYEIDMYPSFFKGTYSYINFGYSNRALFPGYRAGFSIYKNLPRAFEGELGFRYLRFDQNIWIYTGSIGKYYGNYWFNLRPFIIPQDNKKLSASLLFTTRYFFGGRDDFYGFALGYGLSPDDKISAQDAAIIENIFSSKPFRSSRIAIDYSKFFLNKYFFTAGAGIRYTEVSDEFYIANYTLSIGFGIAFR